MRYFINNCLLILQVSGLTNQLSGMGLKENGYVRQMTNSVPREEPEKIRKWREEQKLRLEKKGTVS